jgi:hypothetical protein
MYFSNEMRSKVKEENPGGWVGIPRVRPPSLPSSWSSANNSLLFLLKVLLSVRLGNFWASDGRQQLLTIKRSSSRWQRKTKKGQTSVQYIVPSAGWCSSPRCLSLLSFLGYTYNIALAEISLIVATGTNDRWQSTKRRRVLLLWPLRTKAKMMM